MPENEDTGLWMQYMRNGDFEAAWNFSDRIIASGVNRDYKNLPRHFQCIWDGTSPEGKRVLVRCYHGLGDTIQFIRYAVPLRKIADRVIVWAQPRLLELLKTAEGIDTLIPLHDGIPEAEYDLDVEIMELPHMFRSTVKSIPVKMPYLHVDTVRLSGEESCLSVGLVWSAGDWDKSRSIPFSLLTPLFRIEGIRFCILQADASVSGWMEGHGALPLRNNLMDHARIIKGLDLMITIDSMPAHLAGALNVPVWLLLKKKADWRWMERRTDSPWYPSMKIFRQEATGEWEPLIEKITEGLKELSYKLASDKNILPIPENHD